MNVDEQNDMAVQFLKDSDPIKAKQILDRILHEDSQNIRALINRTISNRKLNLLQEALSDIKQAEILNPNDLKIIYNKALVYDELKMFPEALQEFDRVLALNPEHGDSLYKKANVYLKLKDYKSALNNFKMYLSIKPNDNEGLCYQALCYLKLRDFENAYNSANFAISLRSDDPFSYKIAAEIHLASKDYRSAISFSTKALKIDPNNAKLYEIRGKSNFILGKVNESLFDCEKAISLDNKSYIAYLYRAQAKMEKGLFEEAIPDLDKVIQVDPNAVFAYQFKVKCHNHLLEFEKSALLIEKILEIDPTNNFGLKTKNLLKEPSFKIRYIVQKHIKSETSDESSRLLTEAMNIDPYRTYCSLGYYRFMNKNFDKAINAYSKAIELNPQSIEPRLSRASSYMEIFEWQKAYDELSTLISMESENYNIRLSMARVCDKMSKEDEAIFHLQSCIKIAPNESRPYALLGDFYFDRGQYQKCIEFYTSALSKDENNSDILSKLSWVYLLIPDKTLNNPVKALELSQKSSSLSREWQILKVLAACYAANDQFDKAIETQKECIVQINDPDTLNEMKIALAMYQQNKVYF